MKYKVFTTNYLNLEYYLNEWYQELPNYHLYQILSIPYCNDALVVVIFEQDDFRVVTIYEQAD